ncbi:MAG: protease-associated domain protein, partial [Pseudarthrobacter sp.]|nr:protease-associated domain protein [Pseudarthrobacter sp.]
PQAGTYEIVANLYSTPGGGAANATVQAVSFTPFEPGTENLTVTPNPIVAPNGTATTATLNWTGLPDGSYMSRLTLGENGIRTMVNVKVGAGASASPAG